MGINGISSLKPAQVESAVQTQVFKNALDNQTQNAQQLLQGFSQANSPVNPSHLGNNIDIYM